MASYEGFWPEMSIRAVRLYFSRYTFPVIIVAFNAPKMRRGHYSYLRAQYQVVSGPAYVKETRYFRIHFRLPEASTVP